MRPHGGLGALAPTGEQPHLDLFVEPAMMIPLYLWTALVQAPNGTWPWP
jgi:hypothetical protein